MNFKYPETFNNITFHSIWNKIDLYSFRDTEILIESMGQDRDDDHREDAPHFTIRYHQKSVFESIVLTRKRTFDGTKSQ